MKPASAAMLPPRRLPWPRLCGFVVLLVAVSWALGAFAAWPWRATDPHAAVIRVAFKHVAAFEQAGAQRSEEELATLPRHMRPQSPERARTGRRVDTVVRLHVDGVLALEQRYAPGGLRHDGPTFGYVELPVAPGRRVLEAELADARPAGAEQARRWQLRDTIDIRTGQAVLVEFTEDRGLGVR